MALFTTMRCTTWISSARSFGFKVRCQGGSIGKEEGASGRRRDCYFHVHCLPKMMLEPWQNDSGDDNGNDDEEEDDDDDKLV